jgi:GTPase Era involved in 16S rRNA processing
LPVSPTHRLSKFIKTVAKDSTNIAVGHDLESCTSEISTVRLSFPEHIANDIVLVDTPGFDHTNKTETDILKMVADWLKTTYVILEL